MHSIGIELPVGTLESPQSQVLQGLWEVAC